MRKWLVILLYTSLGGQTLSAANVNFTKIIYDTIWPGDISYSLLTLTDSCKLRIIEPPRKYSYYELTTYSAIKDNLIYYVAPESSGNDTMIVEMSWNTIAKKGTVDSIMYILTNYSYTIPQNIAFKVGEQPKYCGQYPKESVHNYEIVGGNIHLFGIRNINCTAQEVYYAKYSGDTVKVWYDYIGELCSCNGSASYSVYVPWNGTEKYVTFGSETYFITSPLGAEELTKTKTILYPNPAENYFVIENVQFDEIEIFSVNGEREFANKFQPQYDITFLSSGVHNVVLKRNGTATQHTKLVKR